MSEKLVTFCVGPAGTGKSYIACGLAAKALQEGKVDRIVISRPLVACGKGLGFLPGDVDEKVAPYMRPLLDAFGEFFSPSELKKLLLEKKIEMLPLDLMRGSSLKKSFIICDEAQNADYSQLHMLLTRIDQGSRMVVTGDVKRTQNDLGAASALAEVVRRVEAKQSRGRHPDVGVVRMGQDDIVRHPLVRWFDEALSDDEAPGLVEFWVEFDCPSCGKACWYDDGDEDAPGWVETEDVRCHNCGTDWKLFDGDELKPRYGSVRGKPTLPRRP